MEQETKQPKNPLMGILDKILSLLPTKKEEKPKVEIRPKEAKETMVSTRAKAKVAASAQRFLPFKEIKDGCIVLKNDALRAILMVSSINFALMSDEEQKAKLYTYQELLNSIDFPVQVTIQSKKLNISGYLDKVHEVERLQENELLRLQTSEYAEFIKSLVELANITSNHFYLIVPYSGPGIAEGKQGLTQRIKDYLQPAKKIAQEKETFEKSKEALDLRVNQVLSGLSGMGLRCARLSTQEIVELLYNTYNPDTSENEILPDLERMEIAT